MLLLTKNGRLFCVAIPACHKLIFPSPSPTPNLFPCSENLHRVTFAKVPDVRGEHTGCW